MKGNTMLKPPTLQGFKALLASMLHRERFIFELANQTDDNQVLLEVYSTDLGGNICNPNFKNINYQYTDAGGKYHKGSPKTSQLLRITSNNWLNAVYSIIK